MKTYLLSLFAASLVIALVSILAPSNATKYIKLISSLFFLCILAAPLPKLLDTLPDFFYEVTGDQEKDQMDESYQEKADQLLEGASKTYVAQMLTELLEQRFSIPTGEVRCVIQWEESEKAKPQKVTVILSGSAIWKNPETIEKTVTELLGCECITAIE